jgi:hypothetical protein
MTAALVVGCCCVIASFQVTRSFFIHNNDQLANYEKLLWKLAITNSERDSGGNWLIILNSEHASGFLWFVETWAFDRERGSERHGRQRIPSNDICLGVSSQLPISAFRHYFIVGNTSSCRLGSRSLGDYIIRPRRFADWT